jgi:hemolysin III
MDLTADRVPSRLEEAFHSVSHAFGALLGLAGAVLLVVETAGVGDAFRIVSASIYGASVFLLFLSSALYHALSETRARRVFQVLDHAAIFLLVAGTYTPVTLVTLRGPWGWSLFGTIWGLAVSGIVFEALFLGRWPRVSTGLYLLCGWVGAVAVVPLWRELPLEVWGWLGAGGLAYSGGVWFFQRDRAWDHAIWHGFVLVGAGCHFLAVWRLVIG